MSGSIYRELPAPRRIALLTRLISERKDVKALYIQRMAKRGGFRPVTLVTWPAAKLAQEVVRMNAQTAEDEIDLLQALYVDIEPAIQTAFLQAAGVKAAGAVIDETLEPPYAAAEPVARAAALVREQFGKDGVHYLRTIARYNPAGWPGISGLVAD
ncbi:MAG: hypothetical protein K8S21_04465 [Gemmatimonadetes bacterium]|nr:hypothetical protein [Gemmatimonadota bacterium]